VELIFILVKIIVPNLDEEMRKLGTSIGTKENLLSIDD